jgi:hypothetical protein
MIMRCYSLIREVEIGASQKESLKNCRSETRNIMPGILYDKIDNNPYDAPFSTARPGFAWLMGQFSNGGNGTRVTVPEVDLSGKWVIISGSNSGLGREAAIAMAV